MLRWCRMFTQFNSAQCNDMKLVAMIKIKCALPILPLWKLSAIHYKINARPHK